MAGATSAQLLIGRTLGGRYEVRETIATGGMGCIYLARCVGRDATVAVKMLRPELAGIPEAVERFGREAQLARELRHPNIVRAIDFGHSDEGLPYLVMEYVPGCSLAELVRREGAQPIARVVSLMEQLLAALDELHAHGIAHGDVTSDNVLVHPTRDGGMRLRLIDFGLARRIAPRERVPSARTRDILVSGTPGYMAPEVIRGEGLSGAGDVYSAGVVLHELVTGELPFPAASPLELMERQLKNVLVAPSLRFPLLAIPPGFDSLIAQALSSVQADRLAAAHLSAALAGAARGHDAGAWRRPALADPGRLARDTAQTVVDVRNMTALAMRGLGMPTRHPQQLRDRIENAMRCGDVDHMAALYLRLAELLRGTGDPAATLAEVRQAVDALTLDSSAATAAGPSDLWRLLLLLAELQTARGSIAAARASAALAYRHADRVRSSRCRSSALLSLPDAS